MVSIIKLYLLAIYSSGQQLFVVLDIILQSFSRGTFFSKTYWRYFMSHSTKMIFKGELQGKTEKFSKKRPSIIATNFLILVALSYKLASNSPIEVDLNCN